TNTDGDPVNGEDESEKIPAVGSDVANTPDPVNEPTSTAQNPDTASKTPTAPSQPIRVLSSGLSKNTVDSEVNQEAPTSTSNDFLPRGANAVSKGSFTAWTVPKNPRPLQNYRIVIEINLPQEVKGYYPRDLSGVVVGTDSYKQTLPFSPGTVTRQSGSTRPLSKFKRITVRKHKVQFLVPVPGAARLVRDRITLRSKLLKEEHSLELVFNEH
ncbi:hypothetical protein N9276_02315, partial [Rhodopirellula sp.]|nr:hypothetical protein [Rhodopirellula sp.]